jgi:asparagine synthase (glutamine-hydrolysing)
MPGITGIMGSIEPDLAKEKLRSMAGSMWKEPFYDQGSYMNDEIGIYLRWTSHQDSFADCMPIWNEAKDVIMIFSGEDFHGPEELEEIRRRGHNFDASNASYLMHAYEEKGRDKFLKWLNGWFCAVIVDLREEGVLVFNDRYGMGRIYYFEGPEALYFSSEAKSILSVCPASRSIDERGLGEYFACGCVLENRTLFRNICTIPSGSVWKYDRKSGIKRTRYFDAAEWENQSSISKEKFFSTFLDTFGKILPRYFVSKSPMGLSLTGGLDTRMILSCHSFSPGTLPCYTFGGAESEIFDIKIARKIAEVSKQEYVVLTLEKDFFRDFESFAAKTVLATDGTADICGSHEIYLNSLARQIAPVRMTGNYGGEVLREVSTFKGTRVPPEVFDGDLYDLMTNGNELLKDISRRHEVSFALFKEIPWRHFGILAAAQSQVIVRSPYMDNDLVDLVYRAPAQVRKSNEPWIQLLAETNAEISRIETDQGIGRGKGILSGFLSQVYYRFLFKAEYYVNDGMPNILAAANRFRPVRALEKLFLGKHKYLFYRQWFSNELSDFVKSVLLDSWSKQRSYLNGQSLKVIVGSHLEGSGNYTELIGRLTAIELLQRLILDKK